MPVEKYELDARSRADGSRAASIAFCDPALSLVTSPFERKTATSGGLLAAPERLQRALVRLVGGVAGDRERLEPAVAELAGREQPQDEEQNPRADHPAATADDEMGESFEEHSLCTLWKPDEAAQARPADIMNPNGDDLVSVRGAGAGGEAERARVSAETAAVARFRPRSEAFFMPRPSRMERTMRIFSGIQPTGEQAPRQPDRRLPPVRGDAGAGRRRSSASSTCTRSPSPTTPASCTARRSTSRRCSSRPASTPTARRSSRRAT